MIKNFRIFLIILSIIIMAFPIGSIVAKPKWINTLELMYPISPPGTFPGVYEDVEGGLTPGFKLYYDETVEYYYLWVKELDPWADEGMYPFYLESSPKGPFFEYWAVKGVTADAPTGTWQAHMWLIINGEAPMFYLKISESGFFRGPSLIDGLSNDWAGIPSYLRINGDYFVGTYKFLGYPEIDGQPMKTMIRLFFKNP